MDMFQPEKSGTDQSITFAPLADRMRPKSFDEFAGQEKIVGEGTPLRAAIESDSVGSLIFWGPPGSGKTTLARLIARTTKGQFVHFSAVTTGIKEVKGVLSNARKYRQLSERKTFVFIDEIHRFNKAQQDAFLPYVEHGDIVLIGATTENPSFEVITPLLSRMRVYVLERLTETDIEQVIERALRDSERGIAEMNITLEDNALSILAAAADGDARRGLTLLETIAGFVGENGTITTEAIEKVNQRTMLAYDKGGEEHYNIISALHKSLRGGDPDASLYWLARMLNSGEDPLYIIRRLVRFASEDIGLADSYALTLTLNALSSYQFLGSPEGELAIAQAVIYMACAEKSNSAYMAFGKAKKDALDKGSLPVPLVIRNAPTKLMKELGYGKKYKYAHDLDEGEVDQEYFPDELAGTSYYRPSGRGREQKLAEYMDKYKSIRRKLRKHKVADDKRK